MTRDDFLQSLVDSRLLSPEQLETVRASVQPDGTAVAAAERVVKSGVITPWQAQQLLARRTHLYLGRYKLMRSLGQGGMGAVFQAEHTTLRRVVAVKVIAPNVLQDADAVQRFLREIRTVAALHHPNIVEAYDADRVGQTYFFAMEYVPGADLKTWIRRQGRLPIDWSCEVARQTALGLQHAFEHGLVHRDIKPANILIAQTMELMGPIGNHEIPRVKILDLGLARFTSDKHTDATLTQSGQIMGTPDYISPEQAENTRFADIRADLYSLGCTLFEMLTGRVPFLGESAMQKILARMRYDAPRVRVFRPEVSEELDDLIARLMARDPAARPHTPIEAARLLEPFSLISATETTARLPPVAEVAEPLAESAGDSTLDPFRMALANQMVETPAAGAFAIDLTPTSTPGVSGERGSAKSHRLPRLQPAAIPWIAGVAVLVLLIGGGALWLGPSRGGSASSPASANPDPRKPASDSKEPVAPSPGQAAGEASPVVPVARPDDRKVAALVVNKKGWATVRLPDGNVIVNPGQKLPARPFDLVGVSLAKSSSFFASDLKELNRLANLEEITLRERMLGRNPFAVLTDLPSLRTVDIGATGTTDDAMPDLARFTHLEKLAFNDVPVSDNGLKSLEPLESLTNVSFVDTRIRGAGLKHLKKSKGIHSVTIGSADGVNDLTALKDFPSLSSLVVIYTASDEVLGQISELTQIVSLHLQTDSTTDKGIAQLGRCRKLTSLDIIGQQYSREALTEFAATFRQCRIRLNGDLLETPE